MKKEQFLSRRVYLLIAVMGVWGMVIGSRLFFLQVVKSAGFRKRADDQQQQAVDILPPRGFIYARDGSELAGSIQAKSAFAVPREVADVQATARKIAALIGKSAAEIESDLLEGKDKQLHFVWIKRKVSDSEFASLDGAKIPGLHFQEESQRFYPNGELAAHVLGYVGVDEQGLGGLEYQYNDTVKGESGRVTYIRDGHRKNYNQIETPAQQGASLLTTLDMTIQHFVEQEVREAEERTHAKEISVIVTDPNNGQILAMANYPTFNPNSYNLSSAEARQNVSIAHTYEPGSTFKILTVGAALEEGLTTPDDRIDCLGGAIIVAGQRIRDHKSFGVLSVSEILEKSSDVGAITLGLRLKEERMAKYIKLYGFGHQTGIDLPGEQRGLTKPISQWNRSSIGYISMGQEVGVTPLQVVSLVSMVANGGILYKPYVVQEVRDPQQGVLSHTEPEGQRVMSLKSAQEMQGMLEKVVTDGTAKSAKLEGYRAAGKTGTAQKANPAGGYYANKLIASFTGYAPVSKPAIAMVVVVDEPVGSHMGGEVAAPIFKAIADKVMHYKGMVPDVQDYAPRRYTATPVKRPAEAAPAARPAGVGEMKVVPVNIPAASLSGKTYEPGDIEVGDFRGQSLRQSVADIRRLGLEVKSEGSGRVSQQFPPAGARVRFGTVVEIRLSTR
jgi:cell division protein FtsI (penicillin-binding protein 3)